MKKCILLLLLSALMLGFILYTFTLYSDEIVLSKMQYSLHPRRIMRRLKGVSNDLIGKNNGGNTNCVLPNNDPFDDSIWKFFDPMLGENQQKSCNKEFVPRTSLENGLLKQLNKDEFCWGRCIYKMGISTSDYSKGEWISAKRNRTFECDIVEAICSKTNDLNDNFFGFGSADYGYLHTQIHQLKDKQRLAAAKKSNSKKYNVLMLVLDSTSTFIAARNLYKTLDYLNTEMGAVPFKYLNRVGLNSKPNGAALFLGRRAEPVLQFDEFSPKWDQNIYLGDICYQNLDDKYPWIHKNFSDEGYMTFMVEDWAKPLFSYPDCNGYNKSIADHWSATFPIAWDYGPRLMRNTLAADNCMDKHARLMNHVEQFVRSYEGTPKFGVFWDADWGHDSATTSVTADDVLRRFFKRNKQHLKDTFVFISGDHGLRNGKFAETKSGSYEVNNPMLVVVPPEELRQNEELMKTLRENSQKLQTHWDTRATLFDILKHQPGSNFSDRSPLEIFPDGSSYLRRQEGERSCRTLPIPLEYCLCKYPTRRLSVFTGEARYFAQSVLESVEEKLKKNGVAHLCRKWTFKEVVQLEEVTVSPGKTVHPITIALRSPWGAQFKSMVSEQNGTLSIGSVDRLDSYKDRGNCVSHELSPICDCL